MEDSRLREGVPPVQARGVGVPQRVVDGDAYRGFAGWSECRRSGLGRGSYSLKLGRTSDNVRQMSDQWLRQHIDELAKVDPNVRAIADTLKAALDDDTLAQKLVFIYRKTPSGGTIAKGFADDLASIEGIRIEVLTLNGVP